MPKNTSSRHIAANKRYKEDFVDEHGYLFCEHCTRSDSFRYSVHHIVFASELPKHKELHNKRNQILLCESCHDEFHRHKKIRDKLVMKRKLEELFNIKIT